jgi:hypothetical protein
MQVLTNVRQQRHLKELEAGDILGKHKVGRENL